MEISEEFYLIILKLRAKIKDFLKEDFIFATSEENPTDAIKRVVNKGSFFYQF